LPLFDGLIVHTLSLRCNNLFALQVETFSAKYAYAGSVIGTLHVPLAFSWPGLQRRAPVGTPPRGCESQTGQPAGA